MGPDMYLDGDLSMKEQDEDGLARGASCSACVSGSGEQEEVRCPWVKRDQTAPLQAVAHVQPVNGLEQGTSVLDLNAFCNPCKQTVHC